MLGIGWIAIAAFAVLAAAPTAAHGGSVEVDGPRLEVSPPIANDGSQQRNATQVAPIADGGVIVVIYGNVPTGQFTVGPGCQSVSTQNAPGFPGGFTGVLSPDAAATCNMTGVRAIRADLRSTAIAQHWASNVDLPTTVTARPANSRGSVIITGDGGDTINGTSGADVIVPGGAPYAGQEAFPPVGDPSIDDPLRNSVDGGEGDNEFVLDDLGSGSRGGGRDDVRAGKGNDSVTYERRFGIGAPGQVGVHVSLDGIADDGDPNVDQLDSTAAGEGDNIRSGIDDVTGTRREDTIIGNDRPNFLAGLDGRDTLTGRGGIDDVRARESPQAGTGVADTISCGSPGVRPPTGAELSALLNASGATSPLLSGIFLATPAPQQDKLQADLTDVPPSDCEDVTQSAVKERAAVTVGRTAERTRGGLRVELACPRAARRTCSGSLRMAGARPGGPSTKFRIRGGARRALPLRVNAATARVLGARRLLVRLVVAERGRHGAVNKVAFVRLGR